jgi:hypothetical protein
MRAIVRGFAWFVASLVVAALVLRATVFDVWTVSDVSYGVNEVDAPKPSPYLATSSAMPAPRLAEGDVVLVLRESRPSAGDVVRCTSPDGAGSFAMRVPKPPMGNGDPNDLPKPARIASPRGPATTAPKRARAATKPGRATSSAPTTSPAPSEPAAEAHTGQTAPPAPPSGSTCRRVLFRLWGQKGPQSPERRLELVD